MTMRSKKKVTISCKCGKGTLFKIVDKNIIEIKCPKCKEFVYYEIKPCLTKGKKTDNVIAK